MTKTEFQESMENIKGTYFHESTFNSVCLLLDKYLGNWAMEAFEELYCPPCPNESYPAFFMNFEIYEIPSPNSESGVVSTLTTVDRTVAFNNRLTALLLFEQQCLTYQLYKDF